MIVVSLTASPSSAELLFGAPVLLPAYFLLALPPLGGLYNLIVCPLWSIHFCHLSNKSCWEMCHAWSVYRDSSILSMSQTLSTAPSLLQTEGSFHRILMNLRQKN